MTKVHHTTVLFISAVVSLSPLGVWADVEKDSSAQCKENETGKSMSGSKPIKGLPFAGERSFCSLEAYLVFREELGATDRPYFRKVAPNVYEHVKPRLKEASREYYTSEQLSQMFGFSEKPQ